MDFIVALSSHIQIYKTYPRYYMLIDNNSPRSRRFESNDCTYLLLIQNIINQEPFFFGHFAFPCEPWTWRRELLILVIILTLLSVTLNSRRKNHIWSNSKLVSRSTSFLVFVRDWHIQNVFVWGREILRCILEKDLHLTKKSIQ